MNNKKKFIYIIVIFIIMICTSYLSIIITKAFNSVNTDKDYQKLGLELNEHDIDYYTVYDADNFGEYKVYKLNTFESKDKIREKLENNDLWNKNKFYEYMMMKFYEKTGNERTEIDRDDLYYYHHNGKYAIYDLKNAKLYYFKYSLLDTERNQSEILEIETKDYITREVYDVRGGLQNDGTDYYVYKFTQERGKEIQEILDKSQIWSKERLPENILDDFSYNEEILSIDNGYYHYELVCRTSDKNKKNNFTEKEATGWEIGVYDVDKNTLYYYWTSI